MPDKTYLGDSVYVAKDRWIQGSIVLTTENRLRATNTIILEPEIIASLEEFLEALKTELQA